MAKFTNSDLRLKDGQNVTWGTDLDCSMYYDGIADQLGVTCTLSGVDPIQPYHLTTKFYVDDAITNISGALNEHNELLNIQGGTFVNHYHMTDEQYEVLPNGFVNRTDSAISFDSSTMTVTVTGTSGDFAYYVEGDRYTSAGDSQVITNVDGVHFVYYNSTGDITHSTTPWDLTTTAPIAYVLWNVATASGLIAEERHGIEMDEETHLYLHTTRGTAYTSGFGILGYTLDTDTNAAVTFGLSIGTIRDEDIPISVLVGTGSADFEQDLTDPGKIPVFYRDGASGPWTWDAATDYAFKNTTASGRVNYNLDTAGTWSQAETTNSGIMAYYIVATNSLLDPVISIQGQAEYTDLQDARDNSSFSSLSFGTLPFQEMKLLYRILIQTADSFGGDRVAKILDIGDFRSSAPLPGTVTPSSDHGALSGLSDNDHMQYLMTATAPLKVTVQDVALTISGASLGVTGGGALYVIESGIDHNELINTHNLTTDIDHGSISGLSDDDHPQYSLANGLRAFTGTVSGVDPTEPEHLTTKQYVDMAVQGLDWKESVLDIVPVASGVQVLGNRYLASVTGGGWTIDQIYEWDGAQWVNDPVNEGAATWVEDEDTNYVYNGTSWVKLGSTITHNNLSGLQGGNATERYHMTSDQHSSVTNTGGVEDASDQHTHDDRYFTEVEITTISGDIIAQRYTDEEAQDAVGTIITGLGGVTVVYDDASNSITISGAVTPQDVINFTEEVQDVMGATLTGVGTVTVTYDDPGNVIVISGSPHSAQEIIDFAEEVQDVVGGFTVGAGSVTVTYDDPSNTLTISGATGPELASTIDHGLLLGLEGDDHPALVPRDGSRGFTSTVSGVDPVQDYHLTTKQYVDDVTLSGGIDRHGRTSIGNGVSFIAVTFADLGTTNYTVNATLENITDSPPSIYAFIVTAKSSTGFTVTFMGDTDSSNYVLNWMIIEDA